VVFKGCPQPYVPGSITWVPDATFASNYPDDPVEGMPVIDYKIGAIPAEPSFLKTGYF